MCGACKVLVGARPSRAAAPSLGDGAGSEITTLEGLAEDGELHPVQQAFLDEQAIQCGYCINGMVMIGVEVVLRGQPSEERVRRALADNLCRCGPTPHRAGHLPGRWEIWDDEGAVNPLGRTARPSALPSTTGSRSAPTTGCGPGPEGRHRHRPVDGADPDRGRGARRRPRPGRGGRRAHGVTRDEGFTAGSRSIATAGPPCAGPRPRPGGAARAGPDPVRRPHPADLTVAGRRRPPRRSGGVVRRAAGRAPLRPGRDRRAPLKPPAEYRIVGQPVPRVDLFRKIAGRENFVSDVRLPGMLHARVVRPPWFGCPVVEVDDRELPGSRWCDRRLPRGRRDLRGRAVRAVVARVTWGAGDAAPPRRVLDWMRSSRPSTSPSGARAGRPAGPGSRGGRRRSTAGPSRRTGRSVRRRGRRRHHDRGHRVRRGQGVYPAPGRSRRAARAPAASIEVIHRDGPGCYGHNGADDAAADAAVVSQWLGRRCACSGAGGRVRLGPQGPGDRPPARRPAGRRRRDPRLDRARGTSTHGGRAFVPERFVAGHLRRGVSGPDDDVFVGGDRNAAVGYAVGHQDATMHWLRRPAIPGSSLRALGPTANASPTSPSSTSSRAGRGPTPWSSGNRHLDDPRGREVLRAAAAAAGWGEPSRPDGTGIAYAPYENVGARLATVAEVASTQPAGTARRARSGRPRLRLGREPRRPRQPDRGQRRPVAQPGAARGRALGGGALTSVDWESYPVLRFPVPRSTCYRSTVRTALGRAPASRRPSRPPRRR